MEEAMHVQRTKITEAVGDYGLVVTFSH